MNENEKSELKLEVEVLEERIAPSGQLGYEGQPGNQGSNGSGGYEGQPGNQGN